MPENRALLDVDRQVPGPLLHRRAPAVVGLLLPAERGRGAERDLALRARPDPGRDRARRSRTRSTTRPAQYRNYNTYDLFVPEYGDTVPSLLMGGAGMTYEKGNERELRQAGLRPLPGHGHDGQRGRRSRRPSLLTDWVKQWPEAVDQGQSCTVQDNTQVSPPAVDQFEIGQSVDRPGTRTSTSAATTTCRTQHSGDVARRSRTCSSSASRSTRLEPAGDRAGRAPVRELQHQRGRRARALAGRCTADDDAAGRDALHPDGPGHQALDPGGARREPVPAVQLLLRRGHVVVLAAARLRRGRLPHAAAARPGRR